MSRANQKTRQCLTAALDLLIVAAMIYDWATIGSEVAAQPAKAAVISPAEKLQWTKNENGIPFVYVWGDASSGPHGEFVKFPAGFTTPLHTHTADYHGVVISGTLMNPMGDAETGPELRPGSYYFVPGGQKHRTKCVSETDCVFYLHQDAKFDFVPVK